MNNFVCKCGCKDLVRLRPTFYQCSSCGRFLVVNEIITPKSKENENVRHSESRSNKRKKRSPH